MHAQIVRRVAAAGAAAAALILTASPLSGNPPAKDIALTPLGVYRTLVYDGGAAEIAAYDPLTRRAFVVNGAAATVDVIDISDPAAPYLATTLDVTPYGRQANSVAVRDGLVAVAVEATVKTDPGRVVFFDRYGDVRASVAVGALPDMLTFTPNGRLVLVANEGEPNDAYTIDPEGSISIIDLSRGVEGLTDAAVTHAGFAAFNDAVLNPSIRIFGPNATVAQDLEPEYITVSHDSRTAWVTLQENNALAIVDLVAKRVTRLVGLGFKDHSQPGHGLDPSDQDGDNLIQPWPVWGMYQPDAIDSFRHRGRTYLITANEGDAREYSGLNAAGTEVRRVGALPLDPGVFSDAARLQQPAALGRLNVTMMTGDTDGDGDFDRLFSFGARSFSIWTDAGVQVFDSGDALERITKAAFPLHFNASNTNNTRDNRSDDKGPEPEAVAVALLFGRTYAFIGLERIGGIVIYELSNPAAPRFVQYINTRDFSAPTNSVAAGDLGPEGVLVVAAEDSPTGQPLLIVANETSGTTRIFGISPAP